MTDEEISEIITKLDSSVPKDAAEVTFRAFGETAIYANREGYLRLGLEFLKCATTSSIHSTEIDYMVSDDSDFSIDFFTGSKDELKLICE